jgi:polysaccharide export outer membrane protein
MKARTRLVIALLAALAAGAAQDAARSPYTLGPDDQITIQALEAEEISGKPVRVAADGYVNLPMVGRLKVAGLTISETEAALAERLKRYIKSPQVAVSLTEERSQPVSVFGSVSKPGVLQLQGRKTLVEVLALAGGLAPEAGHSVKITRRLEWGRVPLPTAKDDETGEFSVAEVELRDIMQAKNPQENILIMPNDVITVPRAQMVYVIGEVQKAGGIVLGDQETMSVLQAMSIAGGIGRTAKPDKAKILRAKEGSTQRTELAVNLKDMLAGKLADMPMQAEDILFVPNSAGKTLAIRALETGAGTGLSAIIFRGIQ